MKLTNTDIAMAARDFFNPAQLLEFADLPLTDSRALRAGQLLRERGEPGFHLRRLPGEADAGAMCTWTWRPGGFRYEVSSPGGARAGNVSWGQVSQLVDERLTPVRYGTLRQAVTRETAHRRTYFSGPAPFRDNEAWRAHFYRSWAQAASALELRAQAAKDAVLPAPRPQPPLF
ncbi:hypothetical protein ACFW6V_29010 [Streptomyces sp. NPDC058734]|uniref:hypothetical protein n=1 Tax=Streptomyces sp. NPDC058734 TaxID=3346615 RepID=UPI00367AA84B